MYWVVFRCFDLDLRIPAMRRGGVIEVTLSLLPPHVLAQRRMFHRPDRLSVTVNL
jgi:hypothetical protein